MLEVIAILGLSVAVVVLVWLVTYGTTCVPLWKCCRRRNEGQDVVTIQVDLRSGEVRTCSNGLTAALSQSPLHVTQVSRLSQTCSQDEKVVPRTPTSTHASYITTGTQTRLPSPSILSTAASSYSSEVMPLDKSMWGSLSASTSPTSNTSTERSSLNTSGYMNTTYFEETTQETRQLQDRPGQLNTQEAPKTGVLMEMDRLDGRASASSPQFASGSSDDSSPSRSTKTLLAKSESCIFPDLASPDENEEKVNPGEDKENIDPKAKRLSCCSVASNTEHPEDTPKQTHKNIQEQVTLVDLLEGKKPNLTSCPVECEVELLLRPITDSSTSQVTKEEEDALVPKSSTSPTSPVAKEEEVPNSSTSSTSLIAKEEEDAPVPDSDIESYHTCEDETSDGEEDTPTKEAIEFDDEYIWMRLKTD